MKRRLTKKEFEPYCEGMKIMKKLDEIISICRLVLSGDEYLDDTIIKNILDLALEIKSEG